MKVEKEMTVKNLSALSPMVAGDVWTSSEKMFGVQELKASLKYGSATMSKLAVNLYQIFIIS